MRYKLIITERAEELLDDLVRYLLYRIKNQQAALHLLESIEKLYDHFSSIDADNKIKFDIHS